MAAPGHKQTYRPRNVIRRKRRVTDLEPDVPLSADSDSCSAIAAGRVWMPMRLVYTSHPPLNLLRWRTAASASQ